MTKCCSSCKASLHVDAFGTNRSEADGLNPYCRTCAGVNARLARMRRLVQIRVHGHVKVSEKVCNACRRTLPIDAFGGAADQRDGHRATCVACVRIRESAQRQARPRRLEPAPLPDIHLGVAVLTAQDFRREPMVGLPGGVDPATGRRFVVLR